MFSKQTTAMQAAAAQKDSTHGDAPEALAALLIRLLRLAYPNIKTFVLTEPTLTQAQALPSEEKASTLSVELEAQKMLVDYLGQLIQYLGGTLSENPQSQHLRSNPNIGSVINMIEYILYRSTYSKDQQRLIFKQMQSLAKTCPGECDLHLMSQVPEDYTRYQGCYLLCENENHSTKQLYYVKLDRTLKEVPIKDWPKFDTNLQSILKGNPALVPLSHDEVTTLITSNGGHAPDFPSWTNDDASWSQNRVYNIASKKNDIVTASPAETLNLVCRAFLDDERFQAPEVKDELSLRIEPFANTLFLLQQEVDWSQKEKCAGGRQHDLLFLLNHSYLDRPKSDSLAKPIELLIDTPDFLLNQLSSYLEQAMAALPTDEKNELIGRWISSQSDKDYDGDSPIILLLRKQHPAPEQDPDIVWKADCAKFIAEQAALFGLNPIQLHSKINDVIASVGEMAVPADDSTTAYRSAILNAKPISLEESTKAFSSSFISARNAALAVVKDNHLSLKPEAIKAFYTANALFSQLHHYRHLSIFIGEDEAAFNKAREDLYPVLFQYFYDYQPGKLCPENFEALAAVYSREASHFNQKSHNDVVENFFASLGPNVSLDEFDQYWPRLKAIKSPKQERHPLILSDAALEYWFSQHKSGNTIDISSFEVNQILVHALLVPPLKFTPSFANALLLVTEWLLRPPSPKDSCSLSALKKSYPHRFLSNLMLMSLMSRPENVQLLEAEDWDKFKYPYDLLIDNKLRKIFDHPMDKYMNMYTEVRRIQILTALQGFLGPIIYDRNELLDFFKLPLEKFSEAQRALMMGAMSPDRLAMKVPNGPNSFFQLLGLPVTQFTIEQREQFLMVMQNNWHTIIPRLDANELDRLYCLPNPLTEAQVGRVISAFQERKPDELCFTSALEDLLNNPTLTLGHCKQILMSKMMHLSNKYSNAVEKLVPRPEAKYQALLRIKEALSHGESIELIQNLISQYEQAFIGGAEGGFEQDYVKELNRCLGLYRAHADVVGHFFASLKEDVRPSEFQAVWKRLQALQSPQQETHPLILSDAALEHWSDNVIDISSFELNQILSHALLVPPLKYTPNFSNALLLVTEWLLRPPSPKDSYSLSTLKKSYPHRFLSNLMLMSLMSRPENLHLLEAKDWDRFKHPYVLLRNSKLEELFALPMDKYTQVQRTQMLTALQGYLGPIIYDRGELRKLFELPLEKLSKTQRDLMWGAMSPDRLAINPHIHGPSSFFLLLWLPVTKFTIEQREQFFMAMQNSWHTVIPRLEHEALYRLSRSPHPLTETQVGRIISAVQERKPDDDSFTSGLESLFKCPILTVGHRQQILMSKMIYSCDKYIHYLETLVSRPEIKYQAVLTIKTALMHAQPIETIQALISQHELAFIGGTHGGLNLFVSQKGQDCMNELNRCLGLLSTVDLQANPSAVRTLFRDYF